MVSTIGRQVRDVFQSSSAGLAIIVAAAALLRLPDLDARSLWLDEYTSIQIAQNSFGAILSGTGFDRHTPPFYYLLLHVWFWFLPADEIGLRLLSALLDCLNAVLIFLVLSRLTGRQSAIFGALAYVASPFAVYYAQEGRMYSLLITEVLLTALLLENIRRKKNVVLSSVLYLTVGAAGCYTHYYYVLFLCSAVLAYLAVTFSDRKTTVLLFCETLLIGLMFLPWIGVVAKLAASGGQSFRRFDLAVLPYTFFRFSAGYGNLPLVAGLKTDLLQTLSAHWLVIAVYLAAFLWIVFGGAVELARSGRNSLLIFAPLILPGIIAALVSIKAPMLSERYLVVSFPWFIALIGVRLSTRHLKCTREARLLVLCLFVLGLFQHYFNPAFSNADWRAAGRLVTERPEIPVLVSPAYASNLLQYYARSSNIAGIDSEAALVPDLAAFWLVTEGSRQSAKERFLASGYQVTLERSYPYENGITIELLQRTELGDT